MADWIKYYQRLPYPLRLFSANARGYYLRWWRYGLETEHLVAETIEREYWQADKLKVWQEERLAYVLHRAATQVPYYKEYWLRRRRHGDRRSWEVLEHWPILKKSALRENPLAFVADDCNIRQMFRDSTSGTTGTPLAIYLKRDTVQHWYALYETRLRRWHGVSIQEPWAILGGQIVVPFKQTKPPFWVHNAGLNQLYLSSHHMSKENAEAYINALRNYAPSHMVVYPSSVSILASAILEQNLLPPSMKVIFGNAEFLPDAYRETISKAFRCPVINTYGMVEIVAAASECEEGVMHLWPEVGITEVLDDFEDRPVAMGETGRIVVTGILNPDMPLVRYELGDRGKVYTQMGKCSCGRSLPLSIMVEGRLNDLIITSDGRRIFWLNPIFYGLPIKEAQIIQESLDCIRVRLVQAQGYNSHHEKSIIQRIKARVGEMKILLEPVDFIPRGPNGKFRAVISYVTNVSKP